MLIYSERIVFLQWVWLTNLDITKLASPQRSSWNCITIAGSFFRLWAFNLEKFGLKILCLHPPSTNNPIKRLLELWDWGGLEIFFLKTLANQIDGDIASLFCVHELKVLWSYLQLIQAFSSGSSNSCLHILSGEARFMRWSIFTLLYLSQVDKGKK